MLRIFLTAATLLVASGAIAADWTATRYGDVNESFVKALAEDAPRSNRLLPLSALWFAGEPVLTKCASPLTPKAEKNGFTPQIFCAGSEFNPVPDIPPGVARAHLYGPGRKTTAFRLVLGGDHDGDPFGVFYSDLTDRYPHLALGRSFGKIYEGGSLVVAKDPENLVRWETSSTQVFEDRTPRVTDLEGFGRTHIVTILTNVTQGASVAVFGLADDELTLLAQTPYIGTPNRWLNIAGIEDFDGSGSAAIALVRTPHIGGTLQFWRWISDRKGGGSLELVAEKAGFSNHVFGSREQRLSAVEDFDGDGISDLALPSQDRKTLRLVKVDGDKVVDIAAVPLPSPIDKAIGVTNTDDDIVLTVGLEDGSVWAVHRSR